jgi:hypothetical protein
MPDENFLDNYPTRKTLAKLWGVHPRTLMRYQREPDGLPSLMLGGNARYPWKECCEWLERRVKRPNPTRRGR